MSLLSFSTKSEGFVIGGVDLQPADASYEGCCDPNVLCGFLGLSISPGAIMDGSILFRALFKNTFWSVRLLLNQGPCLLCYARLTFSFHSAGCLSGWVRAESCW